MALVSIIKVATLLIAAVKPTYVHLTQLTICGLGSVVLVMTDFMYDPWSTGNVC